MASRGLAIRQNTAEYIQNASGMVSPGQASELSLRTTRSDIAILVNCARMAEDTLDDDEVLYIRFTPEQVHNCIRDLRKWADAFAQWLDQWEESEEAQG